MGRGYRFFLFLRLMSCNVSMCERARLIPREVSGGVWDKFGLRASDVLCYYTLKIGFFSFLVRVGKGVSLGFLFSPGASFLYVCSPWDCFVFGEWAASCSNASYSQAQCLFFVGLLVCWSRDLGDTTWTVLICIFPLFSVSGSRGKGVPSTLLITVFSVYFSLRFGSRLVSLAAGAC